MKKNKRILFILTNPKTIIDFYDVLLEKISVKYEVHILTDKSKMIKKIERLDYKFHYYDVATENYFEFFKMNYSIYKTIKTVKPNLVIGFTIRNTIFGNLISQHLNIPTISPIVGLGMLFQSKAIVYRIARLLLPSALRKTSHIFFYNHDDMDLFLSKKLINNNSYSKINGSGVNIEKFKPVRSNNQKKITFLLIARLLYDKGIKEYYEAAKIVLKKHPNVRFQILGPFQEQNLRSNTITRGTIKNWEKEEVIEYIGCADDVRPFIAKSDCIVLPSYREGLSNVLMEGGSMAKPLLASNVPGCKELIIDNFNGYKFKSKSAIALAESCFNFLNLSKKERIQMENNSRSLIIKSFDRNSSVKLFVQKINYVLK